MYMPVYTGVNTRDPFSRKCCVTPREKSETLTRVEDSERVEGSLDRSVQLHAVLAELEREPATLQNADAVLSGQSSAEFESTPEDLVRRAVDAMGGMKRFVSRGDVVVVTHNHRLNAFGFLDLSNQTVLYYVVLGIFLLAFLLIYRIINSPFGEVLAMGTPREVQTDPGVIEAYLGSVDDVSSLRRAA